jgi:hypothetical protein
VSYQFLFRHASSVIIENNSLHASPSIKQPRWHRKETSGAGPFHLKDLPTGRRPLHPPRAGRYLPDHRPRGPSPRHPGRGERGPRHPRAGPRGQRGVPGAGGGCGAAVRVREDGGGISYVLRSDAER